MKLVVCKHSSLLGTDSRPNICDIIPSYLSGAPISVFHSAERLLALPINIRLACKKTCSGKPPNLLCLATIVPLWEQAPPFHILDWKNALANFALLPLPHSLNAHFQVYDWTNTLAYFALTPLPTFSN